MVKEGNKAPAFNLESTGGDKVALKDLAGKKVVLYFYPKDDTPGCAKEAQAFRDAFNKIKRKGAVVLGVSPDTLESHEKFTKKYELPFPLLVDKDHKTAEKYGVWVEKNMYGKKKWGIQRSTFVIDPDGKVKKVFPKVRVEGHVDEVLEQL
ncbi:MAG: thioredoxin-dependent thiol peroxidase [candidate division Zixibacteria bacterium]|nr:thioredoxin-dependent thiol peroxidase [candidate division Zixibacteria bacterium]NIR63346.1 thioredoxin-dependent thiol peroxidase [candidate division Zixibacteria bacterium]NIS17355.1 thioredoxin-dependent thiol peroxidase [candidate division Zixibacteria bacterium]NIS45328.1 thioredoxin-dependent thiol peroxidase [candidate division Zixibacteria bacterium]NIT53700.1 thioredoxin-dependent thiol peroxidase [candidate division Zixibacteria bacterium]